MVGGQALLEMGYWLAKYRDLLIHNNETSMIIPAVFDKIF